MSVMWIYVRAVRVSDLCTIVVLSLSILSVVLLVDTLVRSTWVLVIVPATHANTTFLGSLF